MPSTLTWLDHDATERERMNRVLALFQERTTVDELGLGGIRDSIADRLFPGTSTIQTRFTPPVRVSSFDTAHRTRHPFCGSPSAE